MARDPFCDDEFTFAQFELESRQFAQWTETLQDADAAWSWRLHSSALSAPPGYLAKVTRLQTISCSQKPTDEGKITAKESCSHRSTDQDSDSDETDELPEIEQAIDESEHRPSASESVRHSFELHIVFSSTYQVPVFYFNGYSSDGKLLGIDEIMSRLRPAHHQWEAQRSQELWPMISQEEHPVLGLPFYFLHPCATATLLGQLRRRNRTSGSGYLVSWLSIYGPLIGLKLDFRALHLSTTLR